MQKSLISALSILLLLSASNPGFAEEKKRLTPAEMLKKLQEEDDSADDSASEEAEPEWPADLPKDLPLYPGVKHQPVWLGMKGYYRWNIEAPTSDRAKIIETIRKGAENGWKITEDHQQSANIHLLQFSREGQHLVVTVSNDGLETRTVYYEAMTDEFREAIKKGR